MYIKECLLLVKFQLSLVRISLAKVSVSGLKSAKPLTRACSASRFCSHPVHGLLPLGGKLRRASGKPCAPKSCKTEKRKQLLFLEWLFWQSKESPSRDEQGTLLLSVSNEAVEGFACRKTALFNDTVEVNLLHLQTTCWCFLHTSGPLSTNQAAGADLHILLLLQHPGLSVGVSFFDVLAEFWHFVPSQAFLLLNLFLPK